MSKVIVFNNVTLDGVMQAPGRADEDRRGGFSHGGWAAQNMDPVIGQVSGQGMASGGALLLGRRTYEDFAAYWPARTDNPFSAVLTSSPKFVASRTLKGPLPWANSTLIEGDVAEAVADLKQRPGKDLVVLGSGDLIQTLMAHALIDAYVLLIHPIILGTGRRLFPEGSPSTSLKLVESKASTTGVVIATYQPAGPPRHA